MVLPDVNVLVYAHRRDSSRHEGYAAWLEEGLQSDTAFGVSDLVLSGFLRVVTHHRVFRDPTPLNTAPDFTAALRNHPNAVALSRGSATGTSFSACVGRQTSKAISLLMPFWRRSRSKLARNGSPRTETTRGFPGSTGDIHSNKRRERSVLVLA